MAGLCVVLFFVYAFVFTGLQEARSQRALLNAYQQPNRFQLLSGKPVAEGSPVAVLEIPALSLRQVVVQGTSATDLLKGPGLMPDTAQPGTQGNSVIAGRRSTAGAPFSSIGSLHRGDSITVVTALGRFHYKVTGGGLVHIGANDPISPTNAARLTLVTSNPPLIPNGREYVTARLVSTAAKAPLPTRVTSVDQRGLSGDSSAFWPAVLWGLILAGAFAVTIAAYRRAPHQRWTIYLLSTPIVMAFALVWFENLIRLLPATL
jgi:sortase A